MATVLHTVFTYAKLVLAFALALPRLLCFKRCVSSKPACTETEEGRGTKRRVAVIGGGIAGVGCAYALTQSSPDYEVEIFDTRPALGGNAKTVTWRNVPKAGPGSSAGPSTVDITTGLSVLAWPSQYFHNYTALLNDLGIATEDVSLAIFSESVPRCGHDDGEKPIRGNVFAHEKTTPYSARNAHNVSLVFAWILALVLRQPRPRPTNPDSLYASSIVNPMNFISLRVLSRLFLMTPDFWDKVIVPFYSASFLTANLDSIPAVILPVLHGVMPLGHTPTMRTWKKNSGEVFDKMTAGVKKVHLNKDIVDVATVVLNGKKVVRIEDSDRNVQVFDDVVFATPSHAALKMISGGSAVLRLLLSTVEYTDAEDPTFIKGVIHSDERVLPAEIKKEVMGKYCNYIRAFEGKSGEHVYENTFVLSSWIPAVQSIVGHRDYPMFVTYNMQDRTIDELGLNGDGPHPKVVGEVCNAGAHPCFSTTNLLVMNIMRSLQGQDNMYFCGSYTTPGNGHDLSLLSGFVVACSGLGAKYPFPKNRLAHDDYNLLRAMMGFKA